MDWIVPLIQVKVLIPNMTIQKDRAYKAVGGGLVAQPIRLFCLWDFPGKNTGVGGHFLLQGIS